MKTILYGAFGRHNFGDLLFPHIVHRLIKENINESEIEFCDVVSRNMRNHSGHNVKSIADFIEYPGPVNIINVGGEIGGCGLTNAIKMCGSLTDKQKAEANKLKAYKLTLGYVLPKMLFKKPRIFIANSVGAVTTKSRKYYEDYDYIGFRDSDTFEKFNSIKTKYNLVPDSAVMTKYFFGDIISARNTTFEIKKLNKKIGMDYIAVQLKQKYIDKRKSLLQLIKSIISKTNLPIVFFRAGAAVGHDSINLYKKVFKGLPNNKVYFFPGLNIWDICNVISNAKAVIGTSLHVRIISLQYCKPRFTLCLENKHKGFIEKWDNINNTDVTSNTLLTCVEKELNNHDYVADKRRLEFLENEYLANSTWVNKLK